MDPDLERSISSQINAAVETHNVAEFKRVVQQYPEWPTNQWRLDTPFRTAACHLGTFKAFVERFPQTKGWACGHAGNPVGLAAISGDVELLRGLLEDVGLRANEGWFFYRPVCRGSRFPLSFLLTIPLTFSTGCLILTSW